MISLYLKLKVNLSQINIGRNDFLLGIQTQFQKDMLIKHGEMCICMDSTYGTNENLITVLIVDYFGEGIPVAWAIFNREVITLLVEFLRPASQVYTQKKQRAKFTR